MRFDMDITSVFPKRDLWQVLQQTTKHIYLYGTGNGADKILAYCDQYHIAVEGFFASDDFVRGQSFHGKKVCRFSDICERYGEQQVLVLVSFATSLPMVMANVQAIAARCETYIPEVPVRGDTLFTLAYAKDHAKELQRVYDLLADDRSRQVYAKVIRFRLTGELACLQDTEDDPSAVIKTVLHPDSYRTYCDVGAYDGDTIRTMMTHCRYLARVHAIEPDRRNFRKLNDFAEQVADKIQLTLHHCAAWDRNETLWFDDSGNRNAGWNPDAKKRVAVPGVPLDDMLQQERVDYIKYDVEGSDLPALLGSERTIRADRPDLLLSLYHRTEDLFVLPLRLHEMCPAYRLKIRRYPYIPAWDLNLYASVRDE